MSNDSVFAGIDVGTTYIKAVLIQGDGEVRGTHKERSGAELSPSIDSVFGGLLEGAGVDRDLVKRVVATGYGRKKVEFSDMTRTEITCHARGAYQHFPRAITIIDIGGQDTKVIRLDAGGKRVGFRMNRKCAAGTGAFLEEIANKLGVPLEDMNGLASKSTKDSPLGSFCTVFASSEILTRIKEGERVEDMVRSAFESVARRVIEMEPLVGTVVMTGGVAAHNDILLEIMKKHVDGEVVRPPMAQFTGAFGAALLAMEGG